MAKEDTRVQHQALADAAYRAGQGMGKEELLKKIEKLQAKMQKIRDVNMTLQRQASVSQERNQDAVDAERKRAQDQYKQMVAGRRGMERQMTMKQQEVEQLARQVNSLQGTTETTGYKLVDKERIIVDLTRQMTEREGTISTLEAEARGLRQQIYQLKSSMDTAIREFRLEVDRLKSKLAGGSLPDVTTGPAGLQKAVRELQQRLTDTQQAAAREARAASQTFAQNNDQISAQIKHIAMLDRSIQEKDRQLEKLMADLQDQAQSMRQRDFAMGRQKSSQVDTKAMETKMQEIRALQLRLVAKTRQIEQCKPIIRRLGGEVPPTPTVDGFQGIDTGLSAGIASQAGPNMQLLVDELRKIVSELETRNNDLIQMYEETKRGKIKLAEGTSRIVEDLRQQLRYASGPGDPWAQRPNQSISLNTSWQRPPASGANYYTRFQNWSNRSRPGYNYNRV